jgi:hypothetical protein
MRAPIRPSAFRPLVACLLVPGAVLAGCAGHDDAHDHTTMSVDAGTPDVAPAPEVDEALAPPVLDGLMRMDGGLHVTWTNVESGCSAIVGERSRDGGVWAVAFRAPGAYDNLHEGGLDAGVLYSYRLRCEKAGRVSKASNEKSALP